METVKSIYRQLRARSRHYTASDAIAAARRHIAGPLAAYDAAKKAWEAEPDKRRYAAGGSANRPKYPMLYSRCAHDDAVPDGYQVFGFLKDDSARSGLTDAPDYGYYADSWQDATYYPCVLIRRTAERHVWACIPAYFDSMAEEYIFTDRNPRDLARSDELFRTDNYGSGCKETDGYSLARDVKDAARAALRRAENDAETAREHDEKWQAANLASEERDEARDELKMARLSAKSAIRACRELRAAGVDCDAIESAQVIILCQYRKARAIMREALETIAEKTGEIADLDMSGEF